MPDSRCSAAGERTMHQVSAGSCTNWKGVVPVRPAHVRRSASCALAGAAEVSFHGDTLSTTARRTQWRGVGKTLPFSDARCWGELSEAGSHFPHAQAGLGPRLTLASGLKLGTP